VESVLLAYSLSGAAGLRSSWAILVVAIAVSTGYLHPDPALAWLGSGWVIALALVAAIVEFWGDKIPVLDHALHAVHFVLAPVAGALAAMSGYHGDPTVDVLLAVLGGGNALFVHSARSGLRVASTASTAGVGNPVISLAEDGVSIVFIVMAIIAPWLTALALILLTYWMIKVIKRLRLRRAATG
jgi:hypothetical protein